MLIHDFFEFSFIFRSSKMAPMLKNMELAAAGIFVEFTNADLAGIRPGLQAIGDQCLPEAQVMKLRRFLACTHAIAAFELMGKARTLAAFDSPHSGAEPVIGGDSAKCFGD